MNEIEKVLEVATGEVGYLEKKSNASLYDKTANAGSANYTKYWADIKPSYQGQPWCAAFVTWCMAKALGESRAALLLKHYPFVYCPTLAAKGKAYGQIYSAPKGGDVVLFYRKGEYTHTGIVVSAFGDIFTTIEGNTSGGNTIIANGGGVCKKTYNINNLPGTVFFRPNYNIESGELTMTQYEELKAAMAAKDDIINTMGAEIAELKAADAAKDEIINTMGQEIAQLKQDAAVYRQQIAAVMAVLQSTMIYDYVDDNMPEWARSAVTAAMQSGAVNGDEGGRLGLSYKDLRSISREYRQGLYDHQAVHD